MKVCFIVGTLGRGGAEKQLVFVLRALQRTGIEARILCLTEGESYESEINLMGVQIEYVGGNPNRLTRLWKIIRNLRSNPADIIQSSHFYTNIYAGLAGKALKIPSIGSVRSNLKSELAIHKHLGVFQISLPDFLIVNSDLARRTAIGERKIAAKKIAFVRNAVEVESNEPEISRTPEKEPTFLFAGRLGREKRADRFVRLASALVEKYPSRALRFQIAGDGVLRRELEKQAQNAGSLDGKLDFLGERTEMSGIYKQADALVLTSDYEGTPNVVLEAMAHGLAVVATNVGGTSEILNEKCGILVDREDEAGLAQAASRLIENPELRVKMGIEGFRYVRANHSLDALTGHLTEIYGGLIDSAGSEKRLEQPLEQKISSR